MIGHSLSSGENVSPASYLDFEAASKRLSLDAPKLRAKQVGGRVAI